jgi:hypothetical protein
MGISGFDPVFLTGIGAIRGSTALAWRRWPGAA